MQGSPPFDGDVEESHELRYTLNSTTTGSPHTDLVSTPDQPSHDTHAGQPRLAPLDYADRFYQPSPEAVLGFSSDRAAAGPASAEQPSPNPFEVALSQVCQLVPWFESSEQTLNLFGSALLACIFNGLPCESAVAVVAHYPSATELIDEFLRADFFRATTEGGVMAAVSAEFEALGIQNAFNAIMIERARVAADQATPPGSGGRPGLSPHTTSARMAPTPNARLLWDECVRRRGRQSQPSAADDGSARPAGEPRVACWPSDAGLEVLSSNSPTPQPQNAEEAALLESMQASSGRGHRPLMAPLPPSGGSEIGRNLRPELSAAALGGAASSCPSVRFLAPTTTSSSHPNLVSITNQPPYSSTSASPAQALPFPRVDAPMLLPEAIGQLCSQRGVPVSSALTMFLDQLPDLLPEAARYVSNLRSNPLTDDTVRLLSRLCQVTPGADLRRVLTVVEAAFQTHPHTEFSRVAVDVACHVLTCVRADINIDIGRAFHEANYRHFCSVCSVLDAAEGFCDGPLPSKGSISAAAAATSAHGPSSTVPPPTFTVGSLALYRSTDGTSVVARVDEIFSDSSPPYCRVVFTDGSIRGTEFDRLTPLPTGSPHGCSPTSPLSTGHSIGLSAAPSVSRVASTPHISFLPSATSCPPLPFSSPPVAPTPSSAFPAPTPMGTTSAVGPASAFGPLAPAFGTPTSAPAFGAPASAIPFAGSTGPGVCSLPHGPTPALAPGTTPAASPGSVLTPFSSNAGLQALVLQGAPEFFVLAPLQRARDSNIKIFSSADWQSLISQIPLTKGALKIQPQSLKIQFRTELQNAAIVTSSGQGRKINWTLWVSLRPRLQWASGYLVAFVAARDDNTSLAFFRLRSELLELLASVSSLQQADVVAIEQIRQRVCSESSEAVKDVLGIFKRLDQGFTPSYVKGHRVEWDNLKFEVGVHSIHSFLDLLLTSVENHFDAAHQDAEVRAKFSNEITNLASDSSAHLQGVRSFVDDHLQEWSGTMAGLRDRISNRFACTSVVSVPSNQQPVGGMGARGGARGGDRDRDRGGERDTRQRLVCQASEANPASGVDGASFINQLTEALHLLQASPVHHPPAPSSNLPIVAAAADHGATQQLVSERLRGVSFAPSPAPPPSTGPGDQSAEVERLVLAMLHNHGGKGKGKGGGGKGGGGRVAEVVKYIDIDAIKAKGLLPPGVEASQIPAWHVKVGLDCPFCKALRTVPYTKEYADKEAYLAEHGCPPWPSATGQPTARRIQSNEVMKHNCWSCFAARVYFSGKAQTDPSTYGWVVAGTLKLEECERRARESSGQ